MTRYARDEFDRVPQNPARQGVHREASGPARPSLVPILTVGVIALVIGLVCFLILPKLGITKPAASSASVADSAQTTPSAGATANAAPLAATSASAEPTPRASSSSASPTSTAASVDKTAVVSVYNATTTGGLASRVAGKVQAEGWPLGVVGNWGGSPQQTSVIFYKGSSQLGNAKALGALLGITTLVDSAEFQQPVVVVLGPGFQ